MNLKKAIKVLSTLIDGDTAEIEDVWMDAVKLGIEALKAYQKGQEAGWYPPGYLLPGETEE